MSGMGHENYGAIPYDALSSKYGASEIHKGVIFDIPVGSQVSRCADAP